MGVPSRGSDQFQLRLPDGMRDRIAAVAKQNLRSMNSEIVLCIEKALSSRSDENKTASESAATLPKA